MSEDARRQVPTLMASARSDDESCLAPTCLYIEVTNRCNSRCLICPRTYSPPARERDLTLDEFRAIVDQAPGLKRVVLHGLGEPLLNPGLPEMVTYLHDRGIASTFNSNALLLNPDLQDSLVRAGLDEYRVSLDGAERERYRRVRGVDGLGRVLGNLGSLEATKRRLGSQKPRVSLWFVAMRQNLPQLPALVRRADELGIGEIHLQRLVYFDAGLAVGEESLHGRLTDEERGIVLRSQRLAEELGIVLSAAGLSEPLASLARGVGDRPWTACRRPWTLAYVTVEGDVLPCCFAPFVLGDLSPVILGNVWRESLADIWRGRRYVAFRTAFLSDSPPASCPDCGSKWSI